MAKSRVKSNEEYDKILGVNPSIEEEGTVAQEVVTEMPVKKTNNASRYFDELREDNKSTNPFERMISVEEIRETLKQDEQISDVESIKAEIAKAQNDSGSLGITVSVLEPEESEYDRNKKEGFSFEENARKLYENLRGSQLNKQTKPIDMIDEKSSNKVVDTITEIEPVSISKERVAIGASEQSALDELLTKNEETIEEVAPIIDEQPIPETVVEEQPILNESIEPEVVIDNEETIDEIFVDEVDNTPEVENFVEIGALDAEPTQVEELTIDDISLEKVDLDALLNEQPEEIVYDEIVADGAKTLDIESEVAKESTIDDIPTVEEVINTEGLQLADELAQPASVAVDQVDELIKKKEPTLTEKLVEENRLAQNPPLNMLNEDEPIFTKPKMSESKSDALTMALNQEDTIGLSKKEIDEKVEEKKSKAVLKDRLITIALVVMIAVVIFLIWQQTK